MHQLSKRRSGMIVIVSQFFAKFRSSSSRRQWSFIGNSNVVKETQQKGKKLVEMDFFPLLSRLASQLL